MANNGDHDGQREHWPKRPRISQISFGRSTNSEQNSLENQTADEQQLDQPGDADGFLQSSVNRGGIPQLTQLHLVQRGASNFIDQGREQPQELMQQQPDTSRGKKRQQQQSAPDSHLPEIRQTIAEDKLARKRLNDKRYRDRIRDEKLQTKADLEKFRIENGQLKDERWELKSEVEKLKAENGQLKDEGSELKSEVEKLKAENGQLTRKCHGMTAFVGKIQAEIRSYEVELEAEIRPCEGELEAENRYSCSKNNDTRRSFTQGCGPPQSSTLGFQNVGPSVQPSNFNPFDDWSHDRDNGVGVYFTEEEIHIRSHETLENEDTQHMLRLFSMDGHASMNMPEDGYAFPPYMPSPMPNLDENRSRPGKAVVGFLKIKAAMRWGFFIRKKAAERRAQLTRDCQGMRSYVGEIEAELRSYEVELEAEMRPCEGELEAEDRYSCSKNNDTRRSFTQGCGPPQSSTLGFQNVGPSVQPSNFNPFDDWSHDRDNGVGVYFTEEEIRIRSPGMLENEDMQHMLGLFSMGGNAYMNMPEDGYAFPPYMPSPMPNLDENRSRPGKAVVGFLKIKAAMRWGFFIRKKAAERRAQIV